MRRVGIVTLYCGQSGKKGFYNCQEIGMAKGYASLGYNCYIFVPDGIDNIEEEKVTQYVTIIHCPGKKIGVHGRFDWNILKKYRIEYVQCNFDNQIFAPYLIKFCDKNNIPVFLYIGIIKSDTTNFIKKIIMGQLFKRNIYCMRNHKCFVKTKYVADELRKIGVDSEIVPVGLDIDCIPTIEEDKVQLRKKLNLPHWKKIILFVGRIDSYKRPMDFIELVRQVDDNYYAVMIGNGRLNDSLSCLIKKYGLVNKIRWIKSVPNIEIHTYYKACDYFINLNDHEIFGMSILEAMYQGILVIAMSAPGPDMIIEDKKNGYIVKKNAEIKKLLDRNVTCDKNEIHNRVAKNFCWRENLEKVIHWLENVDEV